MKAYIICLFCLLFTSIVFAQTKVEGHIYDEFGDPVPFANVIFKNSSEGTITDENGRFYLESSEKWDTLIISFIGYQTLEIPLESRILFDLKLTLIEEANTLDEVVIIRGKQPKKNNPAIDLLRLIWENRRSNGLNRFDQYVYDKYEKVEFDINTVDSSLVKSRLFRGMEFIFDQVDTSSVTGKTYLPIFINEAVSKVYGDNLIDKEKEILEGNKNSGFSDNQIIIDFIDDLYSDYNIYDNYIKLFDKSFVSPLSTTGVNNYNYVLSDSAFIDNKWCYNVIYYPRRKNELTFQGDFWVNDSTYAVKEINLQAVKSANINWVKDIYIEREYELLGDSLFLIKRDYMLSDFAINKKEEARGVYGKRTTFYDNYQFDIPKEKDFYDEKVYEFDSSVYEREDEFWEQNRMEELSKDERGVYKMLDTLKTNRKFRSLYKIGSVLSSGYIEFTKLNFDFGPLYKSVRYNAVEGLRLRAGGRTYFGRNDPWRIEGFLAYGEKDNKFKYALSGKWLLDKKTRLIISGGNRRDVEQIGGSLTASTDVLGQNRASAVSGFGTGNDKLTTLNLSVLNIEMEPVKNLVLSIGGNYRTLESASETFSLDYFDPREPGTISDEVRQYETNIALFYYPGRKMTGYGVERYEANDYYSRFFAQLSLGSESLFNSDFKYTKLQFSYSQPWQIGGFGRLYTTVEAGKIFGDVPLGLLSVVPGNESVFSGYNVFTQLDFYEFITDTYTSVYLLHNFNGRLFSRIPLLRKLNLREFVSLRGVWGDISQGNIDLNASGLEYLAPNDKIYYEYGFGIGNIFKFIRVDFNWRGNYLELPDAKKFRVTIALGFHF